METDPGAINSSVQTNLFSFQIIVGPGSLATGVNLLLRHLYSLRLLNCLMSVRLHYVYWFSRLDRIIERLLKKKKRKEKQNTLHRYIVRDYCRTGETTILA